MYFVHDIENAPWRKITLYAIQRPLCFLDLFRFYDLKQDGVISRDELKRITEAMFFQYRQMIRDDILNDIVENVFSSLGLYVLIALLDL